MLSTTHCHQTHANIGKIRRTKNIRLGFSLKVYIGAKLKRFWTRGSHLPINPAYFLNGLVLKNREYCITHYILKHINITTEVIEIVYDLY